MTIPIYVVDAFTNERFSGNPAAVCLLSAPMPEEWMQKVAAEMNLSETAFLSPHKNGYLLRWFTPNAEVDLCGHATLASAHILWELGKVDPDEMISFYTKSGILTTRKDGEWIQMDFPSEPPAPIAAYPDELVEALGVEPLFVGRNRFDYLIEIESEQQLRELQPNFTLLQQVKTRGVIVTGRSSTEKFDFFSRCFFPAIGVPEDPVTGSAHCCLGPYWETKLGKSLLIAYQASKRGGVVKVKVNHDRVGLSGQAVAVWKGELVD
jgi:PhzF family phenazine biosynthesis protein